MMWGRVIRWTELLGTKESGGEGELRQHQWKADYHDGLMMITTTMREGLCVIASTGWGGPKGRRELCYQICERCAGLSILKFR